MAGMAPIDRKEMYRVSEEVSKEAPGVEKPKADEKKVEKKKPAVVKASPQVAPRAILIKLNAEVLRYPLFDSAHLRDLLKKTKVRGEQVHASFFETQVKQYIPSKVVPHKVQKPH